MARHAPLWQQANQYPASEDRSLLAALWPAGGVSGGVVTASHTDMTCSVAAGTAAVPLAPGQGAALCRWDAAEVPTPNHSPAPGAGTSRVDLIVVQVRDANIDAGANNDFILTTVKGTALASPVAPAVPANALAIASVTVPGGAANLSGATVTPRSGPLAQSVPNGRVVAAGALGMTGNWDSIPCPTVDYMAGGMAAMPSGLRVPAAGTYLVVAALGSVNGPGNAVVTGTVGLLVQRDTVPRNIILQSLSISGMFPSMTAASMVRLGANEALSIDASAPSGTFCDPTGGTQVPSSLAAAFISP